MAAQTESEMLSRVPVIVVLGATGSGKSKLAIEIAKKFGGEILSADSMQVYKGLDIITNKVTKEEQAEVPHHMLDLVDPPARFTVVDFRNAALKIMDRLMGQGKVPIIVGGTNYYIESILWKVLVSEEKVHIDPRTLEPGDEPESKRARIESDLETLANPELYRRLQEVDPDMAKRLHPNNRRRIIRSLQVFEQLGRTHSAILQEQREVAGGSELGGPLRFPHSCILWLQCKQSVLDERLDARVDEMMERGLVGELLRFHEKYNQHRIANNVEADYTKGIFQSIGFKEFHKYLMLDPSERTPELFKEALDQLKLVTRRYSRKQLRWVTNRFLRQRDRQVPPVYGLDTSDPSKWKENVYKPAEHVVDCFMKGSTPTEVAPMTLAEALANKPESFLCDICDRLFVGTLQWEAHRNSKKHQKVVRKKEKRGLLSSSNTNKTNGTETAVNNEAEGSSSVPSGHIKWEENVYKPAEHVVDCFMKGSTPTEVAPMTLADTLANKPESFLCDICDRLFVGTLQWEEHRNSKKHQRVVKKKEKRGLLSSSNTNKTDGTETAVNNETEG